MTVYSGNWRAELGSKKNWGAQDLAQRQMLATNHEHCPACTLYKKKNITSEPKGKRKAEH